MAWKVSPPENEAGRLAALQTYRILDTGPEVAYDEISELAAQICQCPVAVIGMVDETRDWKKSKYGLPPDFSSLPREMSICTATICGNDILISADLSKDERFADHPIVVGEPHIRFYCGMPLINPEGYALGTLCVVDFQPRELTFEQVESVRRLARQVVGQLELRRSVIELEQRMRELTAARADVEVERRRSEELLLNVLPRSIADELRANDRVAPKFHESASVMFADFEGFTRLAERIEPKSLIDQLDQFFTAFDAIVERHRLEKLKTIGDAYMCAGGLPIANRSHPVDACLAALAILDYMRRANAQRERLRLPRWELRIGLHTGSVMAGVVGQRKFIYDIWGDTVNIAARLETTGAPGRVNISEAVQGRVQPLFEFEDRGDIEVKNKPPIKMSFIKGIKPGLSADPEGRVPNQAFHGECRRLFPDYTPIE